MNCSNKECDREATESIQMNKKKTPLCRVCFDTCTKAGASLGAKDPEEKKAAFDKLRLFFRGM